MGLFNQKKDTVEWIEYRPDVLFYKWKNREIKKGSRLVIRAGQKAIFYSGGRIHGIFENEGTYDIDTQIIPFLTHINAALHLRSDTGERAEVYFVNSKDLTLNWGTTQRIMIPTPEVPSGIPVGMNGNMVIYFRDYLAFISKVAGIRETYSLSDVSERIRGEMSGVVAEAILNGERAVGLNVLVGLQANNRTLGKKMAEELDKELFDIGLGVRDVNIISVSYPPEVEKMAEKVAAQSFITDTNKYVTVAAADGMEKGGGVARPGCRSRHWRADCPAIGPAEPAAGSACPQRWPGGSLLHQVPENGARQLLPLLWYPHRIKPHSREPKRLPFLLRKFLCGNGRKRIDNRAMAGYNIKADYFSTMARWSSG